MKEANPCLINDDSMSKCPFCEFENPIIENDLAFARYDLYPVSPGHMLIITKRHVADFFDTRLEERQALHDILEAAKCLLDREYRPDGYNVGVNCAEAAGQTIMHVHIHLIPRYHGDIDNPRGGVGE